MKLTIISLALAAVIGGALAVQPPPTRSPTQAADSPALAQSEAPPTTIPDLCSFEGGRYCDGKGSGPLAKEGGLCCTAGICFEWSGGVCDGLLGWCFDYTTSTGPTGIETAQCHD